MSYGRTKSILLAFLAAAGAVWGEGDATAKSPEPATLQVNGRRFRPDKEARHRCWNVTWPVEDADGADAANGEMSFVFSRRDATNCCRVNIKGNRWRLLRCVGGGETELAAGSTGLGSKTSWGEFILKRRRLYLAGVLGGRLAFRVFDGGDGRGMVASWCSPELRLGKPRYQGVSEAEMVFGDDFMRTPGEESTGPWELSGGEWKLRSSADEWRGNSPLDPSNATRSPNPFVYRGTGAPRALALAGLPFWDDISVSLCVRSQGGKAGLVFSHRGTNDYYVLLWESTSLWEAPCRLALERVAGGKRVLLAETHVRGQREQWYRLGVELRGASISATLQGSRMLRVSDAACVGGRFGMLAADGAVDFDAVKVSPSELRPLEENGLRARASVTPAGKWQWLQDGVKCVAAAPDAESWLTLGESSWMSERLAVSVETPASCKAAIGFCLGDSGEERTLFLWYPQSGGAGGRRLVRHGADGAKVIHAARGGYVPGEPLRIVADFSDGELRFYEAAAGLLLRVTGQAVPAGRVGVVVLGKGGVTFKDFVLDGPSERDWEHPVSTQTFTKDFYMLDWAAPEGDWVPVGSGERVSGPVRNGSGEPFSEVSRVHGRDAGMPGGVADIERPLWWHKGDSFGAVELTIPLAAATEGDGAEIFLMAREMSRESGYRVAIRRRDESGEKLSAELAWRGKAVAGGEFTPPKGAESVSIHRDGSFVWLRCGQAEPFFAQLDQASLSGTRLGVCLPRAEHLQRLTLKRDHVVDEQFDEAAVSWRKLGRWEVSNKFHCDPRWAFMTGESDGLAALWRLDEFPGDVTFEFYAGMRYRAKYNFSPHYPRPGDINAVVAGGDKGVFDGYSAVISGWETTWTRILKNGTIVAETDRPLVPSTRRMYPRLPDLHRRWFYVKLRRVGPLMELYFDNEKVLSWRDDKPLQGGRMGIWTVDNSILVARAKISYSKRRRFRPVPEAERERGPAPDSALNLAPGTESKRESREESRETGCRFAFDRSEQIAGWPDTGNAGDGRIDWDNRDAGSGRGSLRATNVEPGGQFLVPVPVAGMDLRRAGRLAFTCRMDPDVRVNLNLRVAGRSYFVRLTGPEESDENLRCLGRASVRADGKWHRVDLPIGDALLEERPLDKELPVEAMEFGVWHGGYIRAGLGANPPGASFNIDDFEILVDTNSTAISVASVLPSPGQPWGGGPVGVRFAPGTLPPLWDLTVDAGGESFAVDGSALTWDREARTLWFDAAAAGLVFTNRQCCRFAVASRQTDKPVREWELVFDRSADAVPPLPARVKEYLVCDTFEHDLGAWTRSGKRHGALLVRDDRQAASGKYSLKLFNELVGGIAGAQVVAKPFSVGRYPILTFDMRMEEEVLTDLLLRARGTSCRITLTDNGHRNSAYPLGAVTPPMKADGKWRRVGLNLHDMMAGHPFVSRAFTVSSVAIGDGGWSGNRQGASYWIDNFKIAPCFSSAGDGFALSWTAADPGGVAGYSYHWSGVPEEDADCTLDANGATASFTNLTEGSNCFHIRAVDSAGNWGDTSHWLFLIDNTAPEVTRVFPRPDCEDASPCLGVEFRDSLSGVDPESLVLKVNGRALKPGRKGVHTDLAGGVFGVDWTVAGLCTNPAPEGHVFDVALSAPRDFAGNAGQPVKWQWRYARRCDTNAPLAPEVVWVDGKVLRQFTFEQAKPVLGASSTLRRDRLLEPDRGTHVQRIRVQGEGMEIGVSIPGAIDAAQHGYLCFRYRFPPELNVDLVAEVTTGEKRIERVVIELTDARVRPDGVVRAGRVAGILCDNNWHAATVDLREHLEACPDLADVELTNRWRISTLSFTDIGFNWNDPGTEFLVDDIVIVDAGSREARFTFNAFDESGIAGFACSVDRAPEGDPGRKINVATGEMFAGKFPEPGIWYVHARARDNAGNWSKPGHYTYIAE